MTEDLLAKLIDIAILNDIVQQDQHSPSFEITEWSVKPLSDQGLMNPDGLWLFSGQGSRPWSVVLKILEGQEDEPPLSNMWHSQRELFLAHSGLTERMPGLVKAPRFYRVDETPDGAWLWMEHIESHISRPWVLDDYAFAAHQLGTWNGRCIQEMPPLTEPWLARQHYRSFFSRSNREQDWLFPLHQKYISTDTRNRCERLWEESKMFYNVIEALPQTFSHFDSQRRNLFIRRGVHGQDELVLVDWAICGLGPLGAELESLVGRSSGLNNWPTSAMPELDTAAFGSYLKGLRQAGWSGEEKHIRLGYVACLAMWWGTSIPSTTAWWCSAKNRLIASKSIGLAEEELYLYWLPGLNFALDCADEARLLMKELGI